MHEELELILEDARDSMEKTLKHYSETLGKMHAGKASPQLVSDIVISYYGSNTPLNQVASVNTPDPKTIVIQPWDKTIINQIEKAIQAANLGFNPMNDGEVIRINIPPLTEERRKQLVKYISQEAENNRVAIRNIRKKANEEIKKCQKNGVSEDECKNAESKVQDLTNDYIKKIDDILKAKEKTILSV